MPVPKRKLSRARRDSRSANKGITPHGVGQCPNCTAPALPHQVCFSCGFYKGRKIFATKTDRAQGRSQKRAAPTEASASNAA